MQAFVDQYRINPESGCWEWLGYRNPSGYGRFWDGQRSVLAHRFSYEIHIGAIPARKDYHGTCVCHKCDNPSCVNPDHLFLGSHKDNMQDKAKKGRQTRGEQHPLAKLTESDVRSIREDTRSQRQIARAHGISQRLVGKIQRREKWAHLA